MDKGIIKNGMYLAIGVILASIGLGSFLIPNGFLDGGITGISLLFSFLFPISFSFLLFCLSMPFIFLAKSQIGKNFAIKSFLSILSLAIIIEVVNFPLITHDKLLVSIFGGFLLGAGIGISIRGGSVLDGTDILSVYINRKTGFGVSEIILFLNILIFITAGFLLGIETALYSMITYIIASKAIDFTSHGFEEYTGITIISDKSNKIRKKLFEDLGKGITVYSGEKGNSKEKEKIDILFTIVTRLEVFKVKKSVSEIDPSALIIEQRIADIEGGFMKKRKPKIIA